MEMELFDTELSLSSPVDLTKTETKSDEKSEDPKTKTPQKGEGVQTIDPSEDTIIDLLDGEKPKVDDETDKSEEPKDKNEVQSPSEQSADSSKFPYSTFAKALYEEGVLSFFEEDEFKKLSEELGGDVEALIELNKRTIVDQVDAYKNSLTAEAQEFLDALEKGVPLDKYIQNKTKEHSYLNITEDKLTDNDELCKKILREDLELRGYTEEEINDMITDTDNLGKLKSKATLALKKLQETYKEELKKEKIEAEKRNKALIEDNKKQLGILKTEIEKVTEIVPGLKLNAKVKASLYETLTTPSEQLPNGQWINALYAKRAKDPIAWDIKVAYLDQLGVFDGKWDQIIKGGKSAAVKELSQKMAAGSVSKTGDPNVVVPNQTAKDILHSMEVFKRK